MTSPIPRRLPGARKSHDWLQPWRMLRTYLAHRRTPSRRSAEKCIGTFSEAAGAIGISYKGDGSTLPRGTRSSHLAFSTSETGSIVNQCKLFGVSVTSALHASVAASNRYFAIFDNKHKHYTTTVRFSLRPYLPEAFSTPVYASGLYTTGWMKAVPASASWVENANAYSEEYRKGLSKEYIEAHRQYALGLGDLIRHMPAAPEEPPSDVDVSSIGIAEALIKPVRGLLREGWKSKASQLESRL